MTGYLVINGGRSGSSGDIGVAMPDTKTLAGNLEHETRTVIAVHLFIL
jgi:hypothetical protein